MVKQYTISPAYVGNEKVTKYIDGENIGYDIMSYWETEGYCKCLESEGYTRAYDLDKLMENLNQAKKAYEFAQRIYDEAVPHALIKKDK